MFTGAFAVLIMLLVGAVSLAVTGFWLWMLIECLTQETDEHHNRLIWTLVIAFTGVGAPIYFFTRRADRKRAERAGIDRASEVRRRKPHRSDAAGDAVLGGAVVGEAAGWAAIVDDTHAVRPSRRLEDDRSDFDHSYDAGYDGGGFDAGAADGGF